MADSQRGEQSWYTHAMTLRIVGRSSSHFTRIARMFAHELGVTYEFSPLYDLLSHNSKDYAENPALKVPILETEDGVWFGSSNICRELARRAPEPARVIWPEDLSQRTAANAQELVLSGMNAEVSLVMSALASANPADAYQVKLREGLAHSLAWLEQHAPSVIVALPADRRVSFFEISLFCFVTHLQFRKLTDTSPHSSLSAFAELFALRPSAQSTPYAFDKP